MEYYDFLEAITSGLLRVGDTINTCVGHVVVEEIVYTEEMSYAMGGQGVVGIVGTDMYGDLFFVSHGEILGLEDCW